MRRLRTRETRACLQCGGPFRVRGSVKGQAQRWCTPECVRLYKRTQPIPCAVCGKMTLPVIDRYGGQSRIRKVCSRACLRIFWRQKREAGLGAKSCAVCGRRIEAACRSRYCSDTCAAAGKALWQQSRRGAALPRRDGREHRPGQGITRGDCQACGQAFRSHRPVAPRACGEACEMDLRARDGRAIRRVELNASAAAAAQIRAAAAAAALMEGAT